MAIGNIFGGVQGLDNDFLGRAYERNVSNQEMERYLQEMMEQQKRTYPGLQNQKTVKRARRFGEVSVEILQTNGVFTASKEALKGLWLARFGSGWVRLSTTDETDTFLFLAAKRAKIEFDVWNVYDEATAGNVECVRMVDATEGT